MIQINKSKIAGFTLLEVMIVITIAGILASVALPEMNYAMRNSRVKTSASDVHLSFLLARSEAIKLNSTIYITPNATSCSSNDWTNQVYVRVDDDGDNACDSAETTVLKIIEPLPDDVTVTCNGTCPTTIAYSRTGRLTSAGGNEIRFYNSTDVNIKTRCLTLSLSGKPRILIDNDNNFANGCS